MSLKILARYKHLTLRKASRNDTKINLLCPYCEKSKIFHTPQSLYIHFSKIHKNDSCLEIPKMVFLKSLNGLSNLLDLQVILK